MAWVTFEFASNVLDVHIDGTLERLDVRAMNGVE
jgi:hypothetical protein